MLSVTSIQLNAWLAAFLLPFARILALLATAPVFNHAGVPARVKIGLAGMLTLIIAPTLADVPNLNVGSADGLWIMVQQIVIGVALGLTMQVVFAAVEAAGEMAGLQMGLSFATFFQPNSDGATQVLSRLLSVIASLAFLAVDGQLQVISALADTFTLVPLSAQPLAPAGARVLLQWGGTIFTAGVTLALPIIVALTIATLALGILNRAAPQIGIFQVGFPVTLAIGFLMLQLLTPNLMPFFEHLFATGLSAMMQVAQALGGS